MNLAGFVPLSLCDYPGKPAAVIFTQGCNFRCPFCHNSHLLPTEPDPSTRIDEARILEILQARRTRLQGVVVSGGEPTLQADLPDFLHRLKTLGMAVKLDTNGSQPDMLRLLLDEGLVDFIAMDVKAPWHKYEALAGSPCDVEALQASIGMIAASGLPHLFRTTRVDPLLNESDYATLRQQVPASSRHAWQVFRAAYSHDPSLRPVQDPAPADAWAPRPRT